MKDDYITSDKILSFFDLLNSTRLKYILLRNINKELPNGLLKGKDIDILVPHNSNKMKLFLLNNGFKLIEHPFKSNTYLYGVTCFEMFQNEDGLLIDIAFELTCRSLNQGEWLPLHSEIQSRTFKNKIFLDDGVKAWRLDSELELLTLIVRRVFDKNNFDQLYIKSIEKLLSQINIDNIKNELELIFFRFTPFLIKLIKEHKFNNIINSYIKFQEY